MTTEINELIELAYEGSGQPLTTTPMVGTPNREYASVLAPGAEQVAAEEIRVTILGSGDPFVKKSRRPRRCSSKSATSNVTCSSSTWARGRSQTSTVCACR
jgi:hypothetical protein